MFNKNTNIISYLAVGVLVAFVGGINFYPCINGFASLLNVIAALVCLGTAFYCVWHAKGLIEKDTHKGDTNANK